MKKANLTMEDIDSLVKTYALATFLKEMSIAEMEKHLTEVRAQYQHRIETAERKATEAFADLEAWAEANKHLFAEARSVELAHGTIGFRTGQPKLKLKSKNTWEKVLELLSAAKITDWIRVKRDVNKEQMLIDRTKEGASELFAQLGVRVAQEDAFRVEPKREVIEQIAKNEVD
jgi:phage host-nuclease inhibitor protein Gam